MQCNFLLKAEHIPGKSNGIGDSLSRQQIGRFCQLALDADLHLRPIPMGCWRAYTNGKVLPITGFERIYDQVAWA